MTKPLVRFFVHPPSKHVKSAYSSPLKSIADPLISYDRDQEGDLIIPHRTSLNKPLSSPSSTVHNYRKMFDDAFMRPMFGG